MITANVTQDQKPKNFILKCRVSSNLRNKIKQQKEQRGLTSDSEFIRQRIEETSIYDLF